MQRHGILSPDQRLTLTAIRELMAECGIKVAEIAQGGPIEPAGRPPLSREQRVKLEQILTLMEYWRIDVSEVAKSLGRRGAAIERGADGTLPTTGPAPAYVKYRHPKTGLTWDGHGDHPHWLRDALLKEGFRVDELKPENQA